MTDPDPTGPRQVAEELARMVAGASARGGLPAGFVQQLLDAPDHDGALAILIEAGDGRGGTLAPELLAELAEGLLTSDERVRRTRAAVPLLDSLRQHPRLAARLLAREEVLGAVVGGPRRPRLDRALVRVLEAVAPLRSPAVVATVVRCLGADDADLDRLARGVTTLLLESFDELAGLALGAPGWTPLSPEDVRRLLGRLREDPVQLGRLATRCAEHGRAQMMVALVVEPDPLRGVHEAVARSVEVFGLLAPEEATERAAYLRVVGRLMRLTGLQLLLAEQPAALPAEVRVAWPTDADGHRLPVRRLDRDLVDALVAMLDRHDVLRLPG